MATMAEQGFPSKKDPEKHIFSKLDPNRRSIFLWLLDTLVPFVKNAKVTKMDSRNIVSINSESC